MSTQIAEIKKTLQAPGIKARIEEMMKDRAAQFCASIIQATQSNALLAKAEPMSIIQAAMVAATLDLPINPNLGQAYIVPYKDKAQFQMGYRGYIQLAQRSGQMSKLNGVCVYEGALKKWNPLTEDLEIDESVTDGNVIGYAVYMRLVNGFEKTAYWPIEKVRSHAKRFSQAYRSGKGSPWQTDFDAMAIKTVMKYVLDKYAPKTIQMQQAIIKDQAVFNADGSEEYADNPDAIDVEATQPDLGDTDGDDWDMDKMTKSVDAATTQEGK